ncbi:sulfatase [Microlunatus ginsengisoli]|uniref:Sulfatase n=1 Tax=Microlunatus ginsengisoli TaxID=363863 RepID=A0ABP7ADS2_9ACTN
MKAIIVMFDSLNRHLLPPYGPSFVHAPNFERLAARTVTFDNCYAGSMPCMPARREMHTGRYNFLHRSWGPLEPWDDSMPELLKRSGVHTHLVSDHPHYWEDGGATYHPRYSTWEFFRGQEGDPWKGVVSAGVNQGGFKNALHRQDQVNRSYMPTEDEHAQTLTFEAGLDFLRTNADADNWLLQIETFDPHEPFFTHQHYKDLYPHDYDGPQFDWPAYERVTQDQQTVDHVRNEYAALVTMCDRSLGRVLDAMDELGLWDDTMLLVNTDHGFLLGEHGWWAKSVQPWFNELVHLPMFLWDPRFPAAGERRDALVQTVDIAPTMLGYFGLQPTADMQGGDLAAVARADRPLRDGALFGIHGGHVNVTDGRYVYMRAPERPDNAPLEEYTLMPTHMRGRFEVAEFADAELAPAFGFTKGVRPLRMTGRAAINPYAYGTLLFDLETDPGQRHPIVDDAIELRMIELLVTLMRANEAPESQFVRLGLPAIGAVGSQHLLVSRQADRAAEAAEPLPPLESFASGDLGLDTPLHELLANPAAAHVITTHLPALRHNEMINMIAGSSIYQIAAVVPVPHRTLSAVADELAALPA